jgi:hypothetical protein
LPSFHDITDDWGYVLEFAEEYHGEITTLAEKLNLSYELTLKLCNLILDLSQRNDQYEILEHLASRLEKAIKGQR